MKILVYGGAGYIGSKLCPMLAKSGHSVLCVDNLYFDQGPLVYNALHVPGVTIIVNNAFERLDLIYDRPEVIINLAALVGAPLCDAQSKLAVRTNEELPKAIVNRILQIGDGYKPYLIFPNTNSGYGTTKENEVCDENTPLNSISLYGKTKEAAEKYITENYDNYTIFRLATVFGLSPRPRLDLLFNTLCYDAFFKQRISIFEGNFRRNFIHINDVVSSILYVINYPDLFKNEIFNLGNDDLNTTKYNLANLIANKTNSKIEVLNKEDKDKRDYVVSNKKFFSRRTDWTPIFNFEFGISEMFKFFKVLPRDEDSRFLAINGMKNIW